MAAVFLLAPARASPDVLPLEKLRIYETGVAYFERHGTVSASGPASLPVPAGHLDDALKTLVIVQDEGRAKIRNIAFSSAVSEEMARVQAGLPAPADAPLDFEALLQSLAGLPVELRLAKNAFRGRLLEVQGPFRPPPPPGADETTTQAMKQVEPYHHLLLVDDEGAIRKHSTQEMISIRPIEPSSRGRLQVASETLSSQRARTQQALLVHVEGRGKLGFGYIAETPVWRTSYRVVLGHGDASGQLQGWALIHNDTDEHWRDVQIELANGRPQSFLYPLAEPLYAQRELVVPDEDLHSVPQLANQTVGDMISDSYGVGGLGLSGTGSGGGGTGEGTIGLGSVGLIGKGGGSAAGFSVDDLTELSQAEGHESGTMFVYRCPEPLDLDAHHSALVPIVQDEVVAESITWFPAEEDAGQAAARVVNSTPQTWPAGTVSFFQAGGFVGETTLDRLKPRERRFLTFGEDLDLDLERRTTTLDRVPHDLKYERGVIVEHLIERRELTVELLNRSGEVRKAYVGLPIPPQASLQGGTLDFDDESQTPLVIVTVPAGERVEQVLKVGLPTTVPHRQITAPGLESIAAREGWPESVRVVLAAALKAAKVRDRVGADLDAMENRRSRLRGRIEQLRIDLEALGKAGSPTRATARASSRLVATQEQSTRLTQKSDALRKLLIEHDASLHQILLPLAPTG